MHKWQKIMLWGAGGLALALVIAASILYTQTDSAHLKIIARDQARQALARELMLDEIDLSLFPYPQLHAKNITLSNPAWAQGQHFLEVSSATAQLALLPLLSGRIILSGLHLEGLQANLEIAADGKRNWEFPDVDAASLSDMTLTSMSVLHSNIRFRDGKKESAQWQVLSLHADGGHGLQRVKFGMKVVRDNHLLQLDGKLDDLSQLGKPGAVSPGIVHATSGQAKITVSGKIPLDLALQNYDIAASIEAESMQDMFGFFGIQRPSPVPLKGEMKLHAANKKTEIADVRLHMGKLNLSGDGRWDDSGSKPVFHARLQADKIDMVQTFLDIGQPSLPPKKTGQLFRDQALAWPLLLDLEGTQGTAEVNIAALKIRSGIEVADATARMSFNDDRMKVEAFSGKLLGGRASGDALFEGRKEAVHLNLQMTDTTLEQWFRQSGKNIAITGGAMKVDARIDATGTSMNDLAATLSGPVNIQVGAAKILSPKAGNAEFWLTGLFSARDSERVDLSCVSARLPFQSGVARGEAIVGARSDASQLLTRGTVNLRDQTLDLRGRIRARSGINLGISNFAGEVKIVGKLVNPELSMDETGAVGVIARIGAAILTSGMSVLATSIWDGANPASDPCQLVFSSKAKASAGKAKRTSGN
ncbi:Conserved hypothetical protein [Herminiimonas arsenicoxydans]|uniref:AsmA domain-containing protein n=1 Tax=Herminiimonas arsenicoxydans TaxID=204773 RepID=A4G527_HERAR|nr:Conserved hypothetical protein [Herminiimonas arsenicoxydans]